MVLKLLRRYPLITFFGLSYASTWPAWIMAERGAAWAAFPGYFGPAIAAFILAAATQGKVGLETLFNGIFCRYRSKPGEMHPSILKFLSLNKVESKHRKTEPTNHQSTLKDLWNFETWIEYQGTTEYYNDFILFAVNQIRGPRNSNLEIRAALRHLQPRQY